MDIAEIAARADALAVPLGAAAMSAVWAYDAYVRWRMPRHETEGSHGSAHWADRNEIGRAGLLAGAGLYVGRWHGNACTLSGRSPGTDHFMSHRAGSDWRLMVDEVGGLSVRSAIDANVATGILAASMNQPSMAEAVDMAGSALVKTAWTRATKPIARVLQSIATGGAGGGGTITRIGPRPVVHPDELQSLLAEPDTALFLLTRGRVVRRDVVKLDPCRPVVTLSVNKGE